MNSAKRLVLMRGVPSSGKSMRARAIAEKHGGQVIEFDAYFFTEVGDDPQQYDWDRDLLPDARRWVMKRVQRAFNEEVTPIVYDDDCHLNRSTRNIVRAALAQGYSVEFLEPATPWWIAIRALLADPDANRAELQTWAEKLSALNLDSHQVSPQLILRRMERFNTDLRVADILDWQPDPVTSPSS